MLTPQRLHGDRAGQLSLWHLISRMMIRFLALLARWKESMGKLITIVGIAGVGKTTFAKQLINRFSLVSGLELHEDRPFLTSFVVDPKRYALANQVDFLLYRAEQEVHIRNIPATGVQDGGLDQDFHVFTRQFFHTGLLSPIEYQVCQRMYRTFRAFLPAPDLIIRLIAPLEVILDRRAKRMRPLAIATVQDLVDYEALLDEWIDGVDPRSVICVDTTVEGPEYTKTMDRLADKIGSVINGSHLV